MILADWQTGWVKETLRWVPALERPDLLAIAVRKMIENEPALAAALQERRIGGAALDVFEEEPVICPGLMGLPNVLLTPHIAGATFGTQHGLASLAADNLIAALGLGPQAGRPPAILNPEVL